MLRAIRERVGRDFIVGIRMTGDDFVDGGLDHGACQEIAGRLNELGLLDYFNVIGATGETYAGEAAAVPDMSFPLGPLRPAGGRHQGRRARAGDRHRPDQRPGRWPSACCARARPTCAS